MSSSQKKRMFTVPYEFCRYVVKFGLFREASVYLMLKYMCDGRIEINSSVLTKVSQSLKISQRTVKRVLEWLTANDWIRNAYGKTYRVISFNRLYFNVRLGKSKIGIIWDDPDFIDTKAFIITACVSKILYVKSGKKRASAKGIDAQTILPAWANQVLRFSRKKEFDLNRNYLSKSFCKHFTSLSLFRAF